MKNKISLRTRKKAPFGSEEAATLAAAAINAAASIAGAKMGADAAKEAAKTNAQSVRENAARQAEALKEQNENANKLQEQSIETTKQENAENRELQKDIQTSLQLMAGQQTLDNRFEASKIKVKYGGKPKRRLREGGVTASSSLQGGSNMQFAVTDGGSLEPLGKTPEGFDLYETKGNDHEHYHKTSGGKYKSGVGIKFENGGVVEAEGNQNGSEGEKVLVTPNDAFFISKHTINGFNPAKAVDEGMHPLQAFAEQEEIKRRKGIKDDGTKAKLGTIMPNQMLDMSTPVVGIDTVGDAAVGVAYGFKNQDDSKVKRELKCGGRVKAKIGTYTVKKGDTMWDLAKYYTNDPMKYKELMQANPNVNPNRMSIGSTLNLPQGWGTSSPDISFSLPKFDSNDIGGQLTPRDRGLLSPAKVIPADISSLSGKVDIPNISIPTERIDIPDSQRTSTTGSGTGTGTPSTGGGFGDWVSKNIGAIGAGIGALGSIGSSIISIVGNNKAAKIAEQGQRDAAATMKGAYNSLTGIDPSLINKDDYKAAHAMAALQGVQSYANSQIAGVDRATQDIVKRSLRNSGSSAAGNTRAARALTNAQDIRNRIYAADRQQMQQTANANAQAITETSAINAKLDTMSKAQYNQDKLDIAKYNNDINNQKILGAAGADSQASLAISDINSNRALGNAQALGSGLQSVAGIASGYMLNEAAERRNMDALMATTSPANRAIYYGKQGSNRDALAEMQYNKGMHDMTGEQSYLNNYKSIYNMRKDNKRFVRRMKGLGLNA